MRILFNIGSLKKGGAERVTANLANFFIHNNDVAIVTSIKCNSFYKLNENINVYALDKEKQYKNVILKNINRLRELSKLIKDYKPDIIISFLPHPSYRVLFLKLFNKNLKVIVSVRNDPKIEYKSKVNSVIMNILYPLADGFIFQTEEAREYFKDKIQKKSEIIPNPIADEFINATINKDKEKRIINVGRLEEQKNQLTLIQAFKAFSDQYPEYKLFIYGEGSLRKRLEDEIEQLKLNDKVFLPGNTDNLIDELNKSEIFVLSSKYEGMPNALMEAMAMGVACISTDCPCGGPRFLIANEENGILIKNGSKEQIYNSLIKIIENPELRQKLKNNAIKIRRDLNSEVINNRWNNYIRKILGG